jgi:hypothetical protein
MASPISVVLKWLQHKLTLSVDVLAPVDFKNNARSVSFILERAAWISSLTLKNMSECQKQQDIAVPGSALSIAPGKVVGTRTEAFLDL